MSKLDEKTKYLFFWYMSEILSPEIKIFLFSSDDQKCMCLDTI